ncbi:MAG: oxidoreductase membrane subunit [Lachnospiraceae bacterium]|nr:oxidoreductase membrane subunit [Lachnospiraceae bacterium]
MKRITFKIQLCISVALILIGNLLSVLLKNGILCNVAWILIGLLYILHPVCPSGYAGNSKIKRVVRIAGVVLILIGLLIRYQV